MKILRAKSERAKHNRNKQEQIVRYWKLKLLSREEVVRENYLNSFNRGEEWNSSEEIERYKKVQERNLSRKISSTSSNNDASSKPQEESPSPSEGGE